MQPRKGRKQAGRIYDWLTKLNCYDRVVDATTGDQLDHLCRMEVHTGYLGRCAGRAILRQRTMELHEALTEPGREADLRDTFIHELAHLLDYLKRGTSDHSQKWRDVMTSLGEPAATRCHSLRYLRESRVRLYCDGPRCGNTEHTRDPENQEGRPCRQCNGRMRRTRA
jgi:predicted SprT family Zn-dependent metalloprotease